MATWIIVPSAGAGARFGGAMPKQYADLAGAPVLARTLDRLGSLAADATFVVLAPDDIRFDASIGARRGVSSLRCGGATRGETVRNALEAIAGRARGDDWIVVHDAARPCVPRDSLARLVAELGDDAVGGLLAIPLGDTLKRATAIDPRVLRTEDRAGLWLAQTPQMFRYRWLRAAYGRTDAAACTDDAQAIEALAAAGACAAPKLVRGSSSNIKITQASDLALAAAILHTQGDA